MTISLRTILVLGLAALCLTAGSAAAAEATFSDREATYPPGVANVTHSPWRPAAGDDLDVTLRLQPDAEVPARVSLIFCRIEPQYVCGAPQLLERGDDGTTWTTTIAWDDRFMKPETVHLGYNLTMRFLEGDGTVRKVAVPAGNHWVPESYPDDADGTYYFVRYGASDDGLLGLDTPAAPLVPSLLVLATVAVVRRAGRQRRG